MISFVPERAQRVVTNEHIQGTENKIGRETLRPDTDEITLDWKRMHYDVRPRF
jgi:hypothetical protein